jgi:hypothetical protein
MWSALHPTYYNQRSAVECTETILGLSCHRWRVRLDKRIATWVISCTGSVCNCHRCAWRVSEKRETTHIEEHIDIPMISQTLQYEAYRGDDSVAAHLNSETLSLSNSQGRETIYGRDFGNVIGNTLDLLLEIHTCALSDQFRLYRSQETTALRTGLGLWRTRWADCQNRR